MSKRIIISNIPIIEKHITASMRIILDVDNYILLRIIANIDKIINEGFSLDYPMSNNQAMMKEIRFSKDTPLTKDEMIQKNYLVYESWINIFYTSRGHRYEPDEYTIEIRYYPEQPDNEKVEKLLRIGKIIGKIESALNTLPQMEIRQKIKDDLAELEKQIKEL